MDFLAHRPKSLNCALLCAVLFTSTARAQILSPGKLGKGHEQLEGLENCTQCHELGNKTSPKKCLDCHRELAATIQAGHGMHVQHSVKRKHCFDCHRDHRGLDKALSEWGGAREGFDHGRSGFDLHGRHALSPCEACHQPTFVDDKNLKKRLNERALSTYLGVEKRCAGCHFDQHRGQLGAACERCHDERDFKNTPGFKHDEVFPLVGQHLKNDCEKCHPKQVSGPARSSMLLSGDRRSYALYSGRPKNCAACHKDVHLNKFGNKCERCHDARSWKTSGDVRRDRRFHAKTGFKLLGKHAFAPCKSCHPKGKGGKLKTRGLKFEHCSDCHLDAHFGQMTVDKEQRTLCDRCHSVEGFFPPRYPLADHQKGSFPLKESHLAVACSACHPAMPELFADQVPAELRSSSKKVRRNRLLNFTRIRMPEGKKLDRCESCHRDVHDGQFTRDGDVKACAQCHKNSSFFDLNFDHDKDSRYRLLGKHRKLRCHSCHQAVGDDGQGVVRYRGRDKQCKTCHQDPHSGQFEKKGCDLCHDHTAFKPAIFEHNNPEHARYALGGAHKKAKCATCHPRLQGSEAESSSSPVVNVDVTASVEAKGEAKSEAGRWYRGVPLKCEGCHQPQHSAANSQDCASCHKDTVWTDVSFDHDQTDFPLTMRHAEIACGECHVDSERLAIDMRCQSCHLDVHAGRLGDDCARCHETSSFKNGMGVLAHGQSRMPLVGRHAFVACESCHRGSMDRSFVGPAASCEACHQDDLLRTLGGPVDHASAGLGVDCQRCHLPVSWQKARLPEHDRCFPVSSGAHQFAACEGCHTDSPGLLVDACQSFSADCRRCHSCSKMDGAHRNKNVAGYQCEFRKCYECHPDGKT